MKSRIHHVIIGNSAAGRAALEAIRSQDKKGRITIIADEDYPLYPRMFLPYIRKKDSGASYPGPEYFSGLNAKTQFGIRVEGIDTPTGRIFCSNGKHVPYDRLLISTGARAHRPRIPGIGSPDVLNFWTLADARRLFQLGDNAKRIAIIGAGLIGALTIGVLNGNSRIISLIEVSDRILSSILNVQAASFVEDILRKKRIHIHTGTQVTEIRRRTKGLHDVMLSTGKRVPADMIVVGTGTKPNTDMTKGTAIRQRQGILVNSRMETSVENVYAAGDVANVPPLHGGKRVRVGTWGAAVEQGKVAGANMAGGSLDYGGGLSYNILTLGELCIATAGLPDQPTGKCTANEHMTVSGMSSGTYRWISYNPNGSIRGAIAIGKIQDMGIIQSLIRNRTLFSGEFRFAEKPLSFPDLILNNLFRNKKIKSFKGGLKKEPHE